MTFDEVDVWIYQTRILKSSRRRRGEYYVSRGDIWIPTEGINCFIICL